MEIRMSEEEFIKLSERAVKSMINKSNLKSFMATYYSTVATSHMAEMMVLYKREQGIKE